MINQVEYKLALVLNLLSLMKNKVSYRSNLLHAFKY
jgi:hypothetical protein